MNKVCDVGPMVYSPYQRRLESLTVFITKAVLSPQLFKGRECWSNQSRTHDLLHTSLMLNKLFQIIIIIIIIIVINS